VNLQRCRSTNEKSGKPSRGHAPPRRIYHFGFFSSPTFSQGVCRISDWMGQLGDQYGHVGAQNAGDFL